MNQPSRSNFLAVDPGVHYFGWAEFAGARLVAVGLDYDDHFLANKWPHISTTVVEGQQIYAGAEKKKADIVALARAAGRIEGQFQHRVLRMPSSLPKSVFQARARARLEPDELRLLETHSKKDLYHILDAVGIGLKYSGR
jgi:hypothetical protein